MSSLVSQENKELLWGLLSEEGIFDGIPENVTPEEVKHVFERILKNLSATIPSLHAAKLKELHHAKQQAIAEEDYDAAKNIRATIDEMEAPLARLEKLEVRKQLAIQAEDYEAAKQIKMEIDRIRASSFSLKELNKIAIESLAINIPKLARDISSIKLGTRVFPTKTPSATTAHSMTGGSVGSSGGVREIYNAEDFQSQKRQEIEMKMREQEAEMRSYFEVPRPPEIDFSDFPRDHAPRIKTRPAPAPAPTPEHAPEHAPAASANIEIVDLDNVSRNNSDDSPLGDDMERLIAERIAARQRDLDEISERMKATMPPQVTAKESEDTRKVRFQEDTNPIFLKLKRKPMVNEDV